MRNRTRQPPLFDVNSRPLGHAWSWTVTWAVASSGYPTGCHVTARRIELDGEHLVGTASCDVQIGDSMQEVMECLAIESMLAACDLTLDGEPTHRHVVFSSNL